MATRSLQPALPHLLHLPLGAILGRASLRWIALFSGFLVVFLGAALLTGARAEPFGDEPHHLLISHSLVFDRDLDLRNNYLQRDSLRYRSRPIGGTDHTVAIAPEGPWFPVHNPGLAAILAPGYAFFGWPGAAATLALCLAALAAELDALLRGLGIGRRAAILATAAVLVTPPVLLYSGRVFPEVPVALLVIAAFRRIQFGHDTWFAALLIALLPWFHMKFSLLAIGLAILVLVIDRRNVGRALEWVATARFSLAGGHRRISDALATIDTDRVRAGPYPEGTRPRSATKPLSRLVPSRSVVTAPSVSEDVAIGSPPAAWPVFVTLIVSGLLYLLYRQILYGTAAVEPGFLPEQALSGLLGQLFDQEMGLLINGPLAMTAFVALPIALWRVARTCSPVTTALWSGAWLVTIIWAIPLLNGGNWWGGLSFTPRFLIPAIPLLALPLALSWRRGGWRALSLFAALLSLLIAVRGLSTPERHLNFATGESFMLLDLGTPGRQISSIWPSFIGRDTNWRIRQPAELSGQIGRIVPDPTSPSGYARLGDDLLDDSGILAKDGPVVFRRGDGELRLRYQAMPAAEGIGIVTVLAAVGDRLAVLAEQPILGAGRGYREHIVPYRYPGAALLDAEARLYAVVTFVGGADLRVAEIAWRER